MKNLYEEINPVLNPNEISKVVVDTLISASKKSDTKKRLEAALNSTPVSAKKIKDALVPEKTTGSSSTQRPQNTKGTKGTTGTGNKPQEISPNQNNSTVSETIYNKGKNMRKKTNMNEQAPAMSGAGQNVAKALDKTPGLDAKVDKITDRNTAIKSILDYSVRFDIPGQKTSALLLLAAAEAKKKEAEEKANPPAPAPLKEFVSYLFEGTER